MKVNVRGKEWELVFRITSKKLDGLCDPPDKVGKKIRIRAKLDPERQLEVIIHELLHAAFWDMDEIAVSETGRDIARVLWMLGYRRQE